MKKTILTFFTIISVISLFAQVPPKSFEKGLAFMQKDTEKARSYFEKAINEAPEYYGSYYYMGILLVNDLETETAIEYFKKAIALNHKNENNTKEICYDKLIETYLQKYDFSEAFEIAWEAHENLPQSALAKFKLSDVCLWAYSINHDGLDSTYIKADLQNEYEVNSTEIQSLILQRIRVYGEGLMVIKQKLVKENGEYFDLIECKTNKTGEAVTVRFKLNWDVSKEFGGKKINTESIYSNSELPIYERIGALLIENPNSNIHNEIVKLR